MYIVHMFCVQILYVYIVQHDRKTCSSLTVLLELVHDLQGSGTEMTRWLAVFPA